jgi:hypothetical protein
MTSWRIRQSGIRALKLGEVVVVDAEGNPVSTQ